MLSLQNKKESELIAEMEDFIILYRIKNLADFIYYARKKRPDWHELLSNNEKALIIVKEFCHWEGKGSRYIVPWPSNVSYDEDDDALKEDAILKNWTEQEQRKREN